MNLQTDYLVVGAGVTGLSFVDELLTRSDAHITVVDMRDAPGGQWNDAYSFVKLHQPSTFYGVESKQLAEYRIDQAGSNKGFLSLAEGPEITSYCHGIMRDRLLTSGRVDYLPLTAYERDGTLRGLLSGERHTITIRKKLVDAAYYTNSIPLTHIRKFCIQSRSEMRAAERSAQAGGCLHPLHNPWGWQDCDRHLPVAACARRGSGRHHMDHAT